MQRKELNGSKFKIESRLTAETETFLSKLENYPTRLQTHYLESIIKSLRCLKQCKNVPEKCKCECGSSWVVKCPNPTTQQIFKDLPIYFPHYKNGCLEMFLQAGRIITRRPTGTCVYFSKSFVLYLLCNLKIVFNNVIEHLKLEILGSQKVSKLSLEWISFSWKNHLKRIQFYYVPNSCVFFSPVS